MLNFELLSALEPASGKREGALLVVLHGLGDSMEGYRWLPDELRLPWINYVLVNAPDSYFGGYSWYDFAGNADAGVRRSRLLLYELLEHLEGRGYRSDRMVMFGFSQGCLMSLEIGARYPRLLAGIVGISGYVHQPQQLLAELSPMARSQRFFLSHGTRDPLIPIALVLPQVRQLEASGLTITWHEYDKDHTIAGAEELGDIRSFINQCFA